MHGKSKAMAYDDVKQCSQEFLLPCKIIYELHSEFNCLKQIAEDSKSDGDEDHFTDDNSIKLGDLLKSSMELKEKHPRVTEMILDALGMPVTNKNIRVTWKSYLKIQTLLRYFTATKDQFLDFWYKVSFSYFHVIFAVFKPPEYAY